MVDMLSAEDEREIRTSLRKVMARFTDEYWMRHDMDHEFPWDFYKAMAEAGWIGICIPEEYGGGGAGHPEAALVLRGDRRLRRGHERLLGDPPVDLRHEAGRQVRHRGAEASSCPAVADGNLHVAFGVTEPDAGTDTTAHHDPGSPRGRPTTWSAAARCGPRGPSSAERSCC